MVLTEAASNRAAMAILRVLSLGESFSAAAKAVGTTRRTMLNYVRENEVPIQRMNNGRWEVIKTASQKVPELLELMYEGESATRACRQLNTTVRTMSSQMTDAKLERTQLKIQSSSFTEFFTATGEIIIFEGFLKVYIEGTDEDTNENQGILPAIKNK